MTTPQGVASRRYTTHAQLRNLADGPAWRCAVTELAPIATNNPWLHPLAPTLPPSQSERLVRALEAHASAEAHDLATCQQLAEHSTDPVLKMLIGLIVEDEQRHHS